MLFILLFAVVAYAVIGFEIYMIRKQRADLRTILRNTGDDLGPSNSGRGSHSATDMGAE